LVVALQSIVSRSIDPLESAVLSICSFHAGHTSNVIPQTADMLGTVRTLKPKIRDLVEQRMHEVAAGVAQATGTRIELNYNRGYPVVVNHPDQTDIALKTATDIVGAANVNANTTPIMGAEDFAYMLEARPGAFIFMGNGDSAGLHHPAYNFNDDAIVHGSSYWVKLVEGTLAA
jgi:hippurate hydrolase